MGSCGSGGEQGLLAELVAALRVGLHVWEVDDPDDPLGMRLVFANPASEAATGLAAARIVGQTMREAFPAADAGADATTLVGIALGGEGRDLSTTLYGDDRVLEQKFAVRAFPLVKQHVGVAFNDVTRERIAGIRALGVLESMSDALYIVDHEWRYTYVNPAGERLWRANNPDKPKLPFADGATTWEISPDLVGTSLYEDFQRAARERITVEGEYRLPQRGRRQSEQWNLIRVYPNQDGLSIYVRDITARKTLEGQLLQSQKLEAIGLLAGGIAHDFNNLLTVLVGYSALALAEPGERSPLMAQALEAIRDAGASATALTSKLLAFSRKRDERRTVLDVTALVASTLDLVGPLLGTGVTVERVLDPEAGHVEVDAAHLEQVLVNLAINARDAMDGNGTLTVETRRVTFDVGAVTGLDAGAYVSLSVSDNGAGMDAETMAQIFDPFFTTKSEGEGTGLGLSTAYGTITQMGGRIDVTSSPGRGTSFSIMLPLSDKPVATAMISENGRPHGSAARILVVDDDPNVRALIVAMLTSAGHDVVEAGDADEALRTCAGDTFDLMTTDRVMPGVDGAALARAAVIIQPRLPVLFVFGQAQGGSAVPALDGSETAFLQKPFTREQLLLQVRDLLRRAATTRPR